MPTTKVTLPSDLMAEVETRVGNGEARNVAGLLRMALAALDEQNARKLEDVRTKVSRSLADPRPSIPAIDVFESVEQLLTSLAKR